MDAYSAAMIVWRRASTIAPLRLLLRFKKVPVVIDFDAYECVRNHILQRGDMPGRFVVHNILLDSTHIGYIVLNESGRRDVNQVKTVLAAQELQLVAAPIFAETVSRFTPRELEILQLLADGSTNKMIARDLGISHNTVRNQVQVLFRKTGTVNRTQLARSFGLEKN